MFIRITYVRKRQEETCDYLLNLHYIVSIRREREAILIDTNGGTLEFVLDQTDLDSFFAQMQRCLITNDAGEFTLREHFYQIDDPRVSESLSSFREV